ncbi:response regulator [Roseateles asaccharophilus]|uniref:CheY-like chemotaxis protein n=1 Tax=Roseateles asaccharophilus TaxID=582607 RepID=A0ABU2AFM6_9BURK|nr:response regulator [Roseateles asaccharophilus]MDR7335780.1 CheY-like chemotaxis protein [Roseateles asaccharophilus]
MFHELQELLGAYLMPVLIAIPLAICVLIAAFKRDDYRPPRDYTPPQRPPGVPRAAQPPVVLPPLPGSSHGDPSMASAFVTAPSPMRAPPAPVPPVVEPEGPATVLIADDSAVVRTKLKRLLEGAGFTVVQVNDGNEALAELDAKPEIAVLITDLEMPNKDGFELIADVHGSLTTEDLPVIAITGHDELHGRVGQIEGVYGIFKKPWNDRELLKRVESLVHLRSAAAKRGRRVTDRVPPAA